MVQAHRGWLPHCMAACFPSPPSTVDQALQGLPTITQLAQHLPSHHCTQTLLHVFLLFFFPPSSVYFGCPLLFPSGNFEVDRCCLFRGERFQSTKAMVGWGTGGGLKRDAGESSTLRELQDSSHVFFISAGVWSQMERGQSWLRRLYPTHKYCTHTHTKEKDEHALPAIPPSTTSTDYKPTQSRGLYFPRPRCQFGLITLPRFGLWQYEKTLRFKGITNPWTYTYCSLKSSGGGNWEHVFFFQEQLQRGCLPCSRANNAAGEEEESFTHGAPIQPPNTVSNLHD